MGYRIEYGQTVIKTPISDIERRKVSVKNICVAVLVAVLIGGLLIPQVRTVARDLILPGDSAVTAAALDGLVADLRSGTNIGDAVSVFCAEIISGGTEQ